MSDVCVVTGGGSGMGLSAALQMPKDKIMVVTAVREHKNLIRHITAAMEKSVAALIK